jgi:hypothetical protein
MIDVKKEEVPVLITLPVAMTKNEVIVCFIFHGDVYESLTLPAVCTH